MIKHFNTTELAAIVLVFFIPFLSCKQKTEQSGEIVPANNITLSDAQIQLANIKVAEINEGSIGHKLLFTGVLKINEQSVVNITSRATGRIQKLYFKNTGDYVKKGDSLYQFYSDDLIAAEREYFTLQRNNWNFSGRYEPSLTLEDKLLLLGMLPAQITQLRKDGKVLLAVTIYSPVAGTIRSINITEGQYVNGGQTLFDLADDNQLWVEAQVYPDDLPSLHVGLPSTVTVPAAVNLSIQSNICFINPSCEPGKNVTLIRSVIDNPHRNLYPGMLALMSVQPHKDSGIVVPVSSIIVDKNGSRIWIRNDDGSFSARNVTTGIQSEDSVLILSGLGEIKSVVTSGVYLLNSELILRKGEPVKEAVEL